MQNNKNTQRLNGQYFYLVILYDSVTFTILRVGMVMLSTISSVISDSL